jgi:cytidylate kinase
MGGNILLFSGPPRSGKSTVAKKVADSLGLLYFSSGDWLKERALQEGREVQEYLDGLSDDILIGFSQAVFKFVEEGGFVLDSRYEVMICHAAGVRVPAVFVTAPFEVRAGRLANAENRPLDEARAVLKAREEQEMAISRRVFGGDYANPEFYVGSVDTGNLDPDRAYGAVMKLLSEKGLVKDGRLV